MKRADAPRLDVGATIGTDLTVLGLVARRGRRPVYIVWHKKLWCPLACKAFRSPKKAEQEAAILMRLAHPYIVRCFGVHASRYVLTEFLEGPTLGQLLTTRPHGRLNVSDALRVAVHLAAALAHVHERGFLYLDMKPSNVVVVKGRPVLFDFGTARPRAAKRPDMIHGTGPYIAPEECLCHPITEAADMFGLGVTLYELITGRLPFPERSSRKRFPQTTEAPAPMRRHRSSVPARLDDLVLSCLQLDPAARPTPTRLMRAIHEFIKTGPRMWPAGFDPPRD